MVGSALTSRPKALSSRLVLLVLFLYVRAAAAQEGSISGVVETDDGTPLPYATIRLHDAPYGGLTGDSGRYVLNSVPAGAYVLEVSVIGYETVVDSTVQVDADQTTKIDVVLKVSPIALGWW